jgi:hypothetical protein
MIDKTSFEIKQEISFRQSQMLLYKQTGIAFYKHNNPPMLLQIKSMMSNSAGKIEMRL